MKINSDQAQVILEVMGFAWSEGQLGYSEVLSDLLFDIAENFPNVLTNYKYVYTHYADSTWWNQLPKEMKRGSIESRPKRPKGWWSEDKTIQGV